MTRDEAGRGELQKQKGGTAALGRKQPPLAVDERILVEVRE